MLFSVTDPNLASVGNGGQVAKQDGSDILFTASDGVTKLNHELESYNPATGLTIAWVQIPSLSPTSDTVIYVYCGNSAASNQQNPSGVWDPNYQGVWHFPNGSILSTNDSTANANNGVNYSVAAVAGLIDGAGNFNGNSSVVQINSIASGLQSSDVTFSAWVKPAGNVNSSSGYQAILRLGDDPSSNDVVLSFNQLNVALLNEAGQSVSTHNDGAVHLLTCNDDGCSDTQSTQTSWAANTWYYVTGTYSAANGLQVYVNGNLAGSNSNVTSRGAVYATHAAIGAWSLSSGDTDYFNGVLDEVRMSNIARSPAWIATEYNNQSSPATFTSVGSLQTSEQQVAAPAFSPAPGLYASGVSVTITAASGASIRYTTDGSTPSETSGTLYSGPISVSSNTTINAIAYESGMTDSPISSAIYTITPPVAPPMFNPASGTYTSTQTVAISTATTGASIRYTTNGTAPSETVGTLYTGPISVSSNTTINAIAYETGMTDSPINSATYTITPPVAPPMFSPAGGTYTSTQTVAISTATTGASIRYTTNGTAPSETVGTLYTGPISVSSNTTINAIAYESGMTDSPINSATYTITPPVAAPAFSPAGGTYTSTQTVAISTATTGASIRYTTNGTAPSETVGTLYTGPMSVSSNTTINAIAYESGMSDSTISSAAYTIDPPVAAPAFSPAGGTYTSTQTVTISTTTAGASIRYTTDGSTPSETTGTIYSGPVSVSNTATLNAIAYESGMSDSSISSATYTIDPPASAPAFNPATGSYSSAQQVIITSATSGASIRYTTDGSTPTETTGIPYTGPISVSSTASIRAIAYGPGLTDSPIAAAAYTIGSGPAWYSTGGNWASRKPIVIAHGQVSGSGTLTNYPMLFSVTDPNLMTIANGGGVGNADGSDILFTAGDGLTKLNHEIEAYNPATGQLLAWVQIPILSPAADTPIYIYYGNPGAANQSNPAGAWDGNFTGVWHLTGGNTLSTSDSTSNSNNATNNGAIVTTELLDGVPAAGFNGSSYISIPSQSYVGYPNSGTTSSYAQTTEVWFQASASGTILGQDDGTPVGASPQSWIPALYLDSNGQLRASVFNHGSTPDQIVSSNSYNDARWHHAVDSYDNGTESLYVDGAFVGSQVQPQVGYSNVYSYTLGIGDTADWVNVNFGWLGWNGSLSEFRVSDVARSSSWIATEYNNESSPSTFAIVGASQAYDGQTPQPTFSPSAGVYTAPVSVSISAIAGASIRYTLDGSTPSGTTGTIYTGPFTVASNTTVNAIAYAGGMTDSAIASGIFTIAPPVSAPSFTPVPGNYNSVQTIAITSATSGASIRYTTNGVTPTETVGTLYTGPFTLSSSATINAIAYEAGMTDSPITTAAYTITLPVAAPTISPAGGTYNSVQTVSISTSTAGASMRYTTNGSMPSETAGTLYTGPFTLSSSTTVNAIAYETGMTDSTISSAVYTITLPAAAPAFSPSGGTYNSVQTVTITSASPGASIRYSTDGSTPSQTAGILYAGPITINNTATINAIAFGPGMSDSVVASETVTIVGPAITGLSPNVGTSGSTITITGTNFGSSQGSNTVTFNGTTATPTSWSASSIVVTAPVGAIAGDVVVTVGGLASNALIFTTPITYVQGNSATPQAVVPTVSTPFTGAQTAGDLNVVVVGWNDSTAAVSSVTDSMGNTYSLAVGPTIQAGLATQSIYYARNIVAASAGANTVTVNFSPSAGYPDIRILEYSGADLANPVDVTAAASGSGMVSASGSATTSNATDLLFSANLVQTATVSPGAGLTMRLLTQPDGDIAEDEFLTAIGTYSATANLSLAGPWIMQSVAFRTPSIPPTEPTNLTATSVTAGQVSLSWTASATDAALANYVVQRCQGEGCTNFAQVAAPVSPNYTDGDLAPNTTYSYRVQAIDVAGHASVFSNIESVTTQTPQPPSAPSNLAATGYNASQINLSWTASLSNVGIANYVLQRCAGAGCTNFVQVATSSGTTYLDTGLLPSTSYSYQVQALDTDGNTSPFSNVATAATLNQQAPSMPANLTAFAANSGQIDLTWTASTSTLGLANYIVQRCQGQGCTNFSQIATPSGASYIDTGLTASTTYSYRIQAIDTSGNMSPYSSAATATTGYVLPLKTSANNRYLVDQNGTPFLIMADSPQAIMGNLSPSQMATYMADRQRLGFNSLWVNLLCTTYTFCNANGDALDGTAPFTSGTNPSNYDLSTPNEAYFAEIDSMINLAAANNLVVFLDPIETGGWLQTLENNGTTKAYNYGVYVGNRYKGFPNIVWLHGNDFQTWSSSSTDNNLVEQVMAGIASVDAHHLQTIELNFFESYSAQDTALASLLTLDSAYTYYETYDMVLQAYNSSPTIPAYLVEANYEYENDTQKLPNVTGPYVLREQAYWTLLSGGTGQIYGNHYVSTFTSGWQSYLDSPGALEIQYINQLFSSIAWWTLVPDTTHEVVTGGYGTYSSSNMNLTAATYCTTSWITNGSVAITYCPNSSTLTVNLAQFSGPVTAQWYDPSNGTYTTISGAPFSNSGNQEFTTPGKNHDGNPDWILVLHI